MMCSVCRKREAAVVVVIPQEERLDSNKNTTTTTKRKNRDNNIITTDGGEQVDDASTPLCLLHYYTCDAVRLVPREKIQIMEPQASQQLPSMQALFAGVFVDLQSEIRQHQHRQLPSPHAQTTTTAVSSAMTHTTNVDNDDPLSMLHTFHNQHLSPKQRAKKKQLRMKSSPSRAAHRHSDNKNNKNRKQHSDDEFQTSGGYWTEMVVPERVLRTQRQQDEWHQAMNQRLQRAEESASSKANGNIHTAPSSLSTAVTKLVSNRTTAASSSSTSSYAQRRRPSRRSIWNTVLEQNKSDEMIDRQGTTQEQTPTKMPPSTNATAHKPQGPSDELLASSSETGTTHEPHDHQNHHHGVICSSCGSPNVTLVGTRGASHRTHNQSKGEIWGNKDGSDQVWMRYQCMQCGKVWNEEE